MIRLKQFYKNYQIRRLNATFNIAAKPVLRTTSARTYLEWSNNTHILDSWTSNAELKDWIIQQISHMQPSRVHLCDGSIQEYQEIIRLLTAQGTLIKLNEKRLPNSYLARSDKNDGELYYLTKFRTFI
ncbi:hypothetical protein MHBO_000403 [Bonamia ostreae]|uniref:Phosphoenolpyruvate carboxykinase GTP-utilising N-terminal domain-containing protein n=1 Tax=Bonamia ostreae TaxID=126728 RepID=A0ABV2AFK1_9EUKA